MNNEHAIPPSLRKHAPWTDEEHDAAVARSTTMIDGHNANHRRTANFGFFAATVFLTFFFLGRDTAPQLALLALAGATALALVIAFRSGGAMRSLPANINEWRTDVGADPLTMSELLLLRSHACSDTAIEVTLDRWVSTGRPLRRRDYEALATSLRANGRDVPHLARDIGEDRWAEAL